MDAIRFDGKNFKDIEDFLVDSNIVATKESNGKVKVINKYDREETTIFKDDLLVFDDKYGFMIYKPSYVTN